MLVFVFLTEWSITIREILIMRRSKCFAVLLFLLFLLLTALSLDLGRGVSAKCRILKQKFARESASNYSATIVSNTIRGLKKGYYKAETAEEKESWAKAIVVNFCQFRQRRVVSDENFNNCLIRGLVPYEVSEKYLPDLYRDLHLAWYRTLVPYQHPQTNPF